MAGLSKSFILAVAVGSVSSFALSDVAAPSSHAEEGNLIQAAAAWPDDKACDGDGCEEDSMHLLQVHNISQAQPKEAETACSCKGDTCKRIFIMRHAERANGYSPLNFCGWERAYEYSKWFTKNYPEAVQDIWAFNYEMSRWPTSKQRCAQTASFTANAFKLPIKWVTCNKCKIKSKSCGLEQDEEMKNVALNDLKHPPRHHLHHTLIFWEHENIPTLFNKLTGQNLLTYMPKGWKDSNYDTFLEIYFSSGKYCRTKVSSFHIHPAFHHHPRVGPSKCPECHKDPSEKKSAWCYDRTPVMQKGDLDLGRCPK